MSRHPQRKQTASPIALVTETAKSFQVFHVGRYFRTFATNRRRSDGDRSWGKYCLWEYEGRGVSGPRRFFRRVNASAPAHDVHSASRLRQPWHKQPMGFANCPLMGKWHGARADDDGENCWCGLAQTA